MVDVSERLEDVDHRPSCLLLGKAPLVEDPLKELPARQVGERQVVVIGRLKPARDMKKGKGVSWKHNQEAVVSATPAVGCKDELK